MTNCAALIVVGAQQAGQEAALLVDAADLLQELDRTGGAGDRAGVSGLTVLVEEVGDPAGEDFVAGFGERRQDAARPENPPCFVVGGVEDDFLHRAAEIVVSPQPRQVLVAI